MILKIGQHMKLMVYRNRHTYPLGITFGPKLKEYPGIFIISILFYNIVVSW